MRLKVRKIHFSFLAILVSVILAIYLISLLVPVLWTVMTSLKTVDEYQNLGPDFSGNPLWWFKYESPTLDHFVTAFNRFKLYEEDRNEKDFWDYFIQISDISAKNQIANETIDLQWIASSGKEKYLTVFEFILDNDIEYEVVNNLVEKI